MGIEHPSIRVNECRTIGFIILAQSKRKKISRGFTRDSTIKNPDKMKMNREATVCSYRRSISPLQHTRAQSKTKAGADRRRTPRRPPFDMKYRDQRSRNEIRPRKFITFTVACPSPTVPLSFRPPPSEFIAALAKFPRAMLRLFGAEASR